MLKSDELRSLLNPGIPPDFIKLIIVRKFRVNLTY